MHADFSCLLTTLQSAGHGETYMACRWAIGPPMPNGRNPSTGLFQHTMQGCTADVYVFLIRTFPNQEMCVQQRKQLQPANVYKSLLHAALATCMVTKPCT